MNFVFRVDASVRIGGGHVVRCLTLAKALAKYENVKRIVFICSAYPGNMSQLITGAGFEVRLLEKEIDHTTENINGKLVAKDQHESLDLKNDAIQTIREIDRFKVNVDWLIIDHYSINSDWENSLRNHVERIMVIDDLANREHVCEVLLDQNYTKNGSKYDDLVDSTCIKLIGSKYALLRPEFHDLRLNIANQAETTTKKAIRNIVILFGASDPFNHTCKVIEAIKQSQVSLDSLNIIIGKSSTNIPFIKESIRELEYASLHVQVENVHEYLIEADLAIGAGGATSWERCCLGIPGLVITTASNQIEGAKALAEKGAHLLLGHNEEVSTIAIAESINVLNRNPQLLKLLATSAFDITDGKGGQRVCSILMNQSISLQPATRKDSDDLFHWRNSKQIRAASFNSDIIARNDHDKWFQSVLNNENQILLIGKQGNNSLGVVRFDLCGSVSKISIYLTPEKIGTGAGALLINASTEWISNHYPQVRKIEARILPGNLASEKAFQKAGYKVKHTCLSYLLDK